MSGRRFIRKTNTKTCMVNPRGHDGGSWADSAGGGHGGGGGPGVQYTPV